MLASATTVAAVIFFVTIAVIALAGISAALGRKSLLTDMWRAIKKVLGREQ